jgi:hypothetical protein
LVAKRQAGPRFRPVQARFCAAQARFDKCSYLFRVSAARRGRATKRRRTLLR